MNTKYDGHLTWLQVYHESMKDCYSYIGVGTYGKSPAQIEATKKLVEDSPKLLAALVKIVEAREEQWQKGNIIEGSVNRAAAVLIAIDEARKLIEEEQK